MNIILFILMLISTSALITVNWFKIVLATVILKCVSSILFIAIAWYSYKKNPFNTKFFALMFLGLLFFLGGDVFLALDTNKGIFFVIGVANCSIGHILYSLGYCSMTKISLKDIFIFLCFFIPTLLTILFGKFEFNGMKMLIVFYAVIISFMVCKSLSMLKFYYNSTKPVLLMISGSVLFFISDWTLLFLFFYPNASPALQMVDWILYYLGQGLLGLSFSYPLKNIAIDKSAKNLQHFDATSYN